MFSKLPATTATFLVFLSLHISKDQMANATSIRDRCECVNTIDFVPYRKITFFAITEKSSFCKNTEIILHQRNNKEVCLNPDSKQGQGLQECWRVKKDPARIKTCIRQKIRQDRKVKKQS
ncbi:chemokine (C-X-C motif) ligand 18a, duplicate 1 [Polyodon spathula]|uniref:chemokine (C-X-C motif) ligand 18a, duplicate 1 n=1 Tax=Polyodon spathula TaxID=7913 RepID=UPI001B7DBEEF|nr:chemokine (C-X-C motif) ligand 18a, duplicate 1 [Polyodon spathula]